MSANPDGDGGTHTEQWVVYSQSGVTSGEPYLEAFDCVRAAFSLVVLKQSHWVLDISLLFAGSFPGGRFWGTPWLPSGNFEKQGILSTDF